MNQNQINQILTHALTGAVTAAAVDFMAFKSFKTFHDLANYEWAVAGFRWVTGAVTGVLIGAGFSVNS